MTPIAEFFGPPAAPLFGWLHAGADPAAPPPALGVLLCPPLGQEMSNCYRSLQALAQDLARRGLPCLRMDYAGCGDSADLPPADAGLGVVSAWQASVVQGIAHLRARTGVRRVALLAIRSGALLAGPVAAQQADVAALVAVAPVVSGRQLLREWRALAAAAAYQTARAEGGLEVGGALYSAATCQQLGQIALADLAWPTGLAVQLIDRDDLPSAGRWLAALQAQGRVVDHQPLSGIGDMLCEPQHHVVPEALLRATGDWLVGQATRLGEQAAAGQAEPAAATPAEPASPPARRQARTQALVAPGVEEEVMPLGDPSMGDASMGDASAGDASARHAGTPLFAILTRPSQPRPGGATLLLPNTGPVHHIGGHRLYVLLARHLAGLGHQVLRLDLSGLGDSPARPGTIAAEPSYGPHAVDDLALALRAAQAHWPDAPVQLLGLCAGGYHALRLAVRQAGAAQCFIVNPLVYHWPQGLTLDQYEMQLQGAYYGSKWRRWDSWHRLLTGQSDWRLLVQVAADKLLRAFRRPAAASEPGKDLGWDLQAAVQHGTRLHFVFADQEPGWPALQSQAGSVLAALQASGQLRVHHLGQADHTLSSADARQRLIALVAQHLVRDPQPRPITPTSSRAQLAGSGTAERL